LLGEEKVATKTPEATEPDSDRQEVQQKCVDEARFANENMHNGPDDRKHKKYYTGSLCYHGSLQRSLLRGLALAPNVTPPIENESAHQDKENEPNHEELVLGCHTASFLCGFLSVQFVTVSPEFWSDVGQLHRLPRNSLVTIPWDHLQCRT
jgi:hypothetical protein